MLPDHRDLVMGARSELQNAMHQDQERPTKRAESTPANKPNINHTYHVHHPHKRPPLHDFADDPSVAEINKLQIKEVENYRSAMNKMAEDIIVLRTQLVMVEAENSQLRSDLSLRQHLGRDLQDDTDVDVMTKAEISDHIASLKFRLASEASKAASQRDRIQQLQNELIKKNDRERELLKLHKDGQQQQEHLQHHQGHLAKMATLEATIKQQEKVIEKMEKALNSKLAERNREGGDRSLALKKHRDDGQLYIVGREKQDLLTKLSEHRHGFARTSTMILHNGSPVS
ncbi:hypothetical protein INR49_010824 [Caranx melampygus]|nr:hypothetical protein INR49_010824 [Caranx melampygus]